MAVPLNMRNDIRPMGADGVPRAEITPRWRTCRRRLRRPPRGRGRPRRATGRGCPPSRRPACQRRASGATPRVPDSGGHRALPQARDERGGHGRDVPRGRPRQSHRGRLRAPMGLGRVSRHRVEPQREGVRLGRGVAPAPARRGVAATPTFSTLPQPSRPAGLLSSAQ